MRPTKAIYVDWHLPRKRRGKVSLCKKSWEIALIIRNTHFAKTVNLLSTVLYCDKETLVYYETIGLDKCFDEIHPILPDSVRFDPDIFWAAGKFIAIQNSDENFLMLDLDLEIRFKLDIEECDIFCSHEEEIDDDNLLYYPLPEYLDPDNMICKKYGFEWSNRSYNTAILHFKDQSIAKEYSNACLDIVNQINEINPAFETGYMLLVEQRFLYEFAKAKGLKVKTLISGLYRERNERIKTEARFEESNSDEIGKKGFLHIWGFKNRMEGEESSLYSSLLLSRQNLTKQIGECVDINNQILEKERIIFS